MSVGHQLSNSTFEMLDSIAEQMDKNMNYMNNESQKILEKEQSLSDINEVMKVTIRDIATRIEQFKV